jgi:hypothetical protein
MAAHSKFTPELQQGIIDAVSIGTKPRVAAGANGISHETFRQWRIAAEKGDPGKADFFERLQMAEDQCQHSVVVASRLGIQNDPQKALDWLEARFPKDWSRRYKTEMLEAERLWLATLEAVCSDAGIAARLRSGEDPVLVVEAVCLRLARLDSEGAAGAVQSATQRPEPADPIQH